MLYYRSLCLTRDSALLMPNFDLDLPHRCLRNLTDTLVVFCHMTHKKWRLIPSFTSFTPPTLVYYRTLSLHPGPPCCMSSFPLTNLTDILAIWQMSS
ncbi:unnamed protein product [Schistocephalus solidus]|uniref:Ovule protein n=1 Tax=Schistocephalus solidus TaxID=70667 RepID=A0A183TTL1_SCHSO|nr:unnamed protein product [Schistocephalus solidus]